MAARSISYHYHQEEFETKDGIMTMDEIKQRKRDVVSGYY